MISSYQTIQENISLINSKLSGKCQIQKIATSSRYIVFQIRVAGENLYIYLGRGAGYEGIWSSNAGIPQELRKKDKLVELFKKNYLNLRLLKIELDSDDRIVSLKFGTQDIEKKLIWGWVGRKSYFISDLDNKYFKSWASKDKILDASFNYFDEIGRKKVDKNIKSNNLEISEQLKDELKLLLPNQKKKNKLNKKFKAINQDIEKIENFLTIEKELKEGKIKLDDQSLIKSGIKVKFEKGMEYFQKRDKVFDKIKKLKKAIILQKDRLSTETIIKPSKEKIENNLKIIQPIWTKSNDEQVVISVQKNETNFSKVTHTDYEFLYGLNSHGNDEVRKLGKDTDIWVHHANKESLHAIIKSEKTKDLDLALKEIAKIMARSGETEVDLIHTQLKNVKSIKGKAGLVKYTKQKMIRIYL